MKCEDAVLLMNSVIDGEATPEQEQLLRFHLNGCSSCRRTMIINRSISSGVAQLQEPDPPSDLLDTVMKRIDSGNYDRSPLGTHPVRMIRAQWKIAALIPFAAAALLLFGSQLRSHGSSVYTEGSMMSVQSGNEPVLYAPAPVVAYSRPSSVTTF